MQRYHNINKNVYNGSTWIINIQIFDNVTNTYLFELLLSLLLSTRFLGAVFLGKFLWGLPSLSEELSALLLQRYHNINKNVYNGSTWIINIQIFDNVTNTYLFELLLSLLLSTRFLGAVFLGKFLWELPSLSEELSALLLQRYHNINKNVYNGSTWIINIQIFDNVTNTYLFELLLSLLLSTRFLGAISLGK